MERTQLINHKGLQIFYIDFSDLQIAEDVEEVAVKIRAYIRSKPAKSIYTLTNVEGTHFNSSIKNIFSELAKNNNPYVKAGAIIGVSGLKQIMFNGIMKLSGRDVKCCSTIDEAKEWLLKQI
jgi:hypothetical protein